MVLNTQVDQERIVAILARCVSPITAASIYRGAVRKGAAGTPVGPQVLDARFVDTCSRALALFCPDARLRQESIRELHSMAAADAPCTVPQPVVVPIVVEQDIVAARLGSRSFAQRLGFGTTDQAKIATAVSELARNIHRYAGRGSISISALQPPRAGIQISAKDEGPGISNVSEILAGDYRSRTGLGLGIVGCKRLMDEFSIVSEIGRGTCVTLAKYLARTR